jgi:hypothetical protein
MKGLNPGRRWEWHPVADAFTRWVAENVSDPHTLAGLATITADYFLALHVEVDGET